jgi:hypothetical protein
MTLYPLVVLFRILIHQAGATSKNQPGFLHRACLNAALFVSYLIIIIYYYFHRISNEIPGFFAKKVRTL